MDGDTLYSIGDLARRTELSVRTIRFYSDRGVLPPTSRSPAGYRRYDLDALARLDLIRALRDLGVDLATIQRVLDRELSVPEVWSSTIWSAGTPKRSARPTPRITAASCCSDCRSPTTHGLSGTGTCSPPSTAGPLRRPWLRFSSGSSKHSSTTRAPDTGVTTGDSPPALTADLTSGNELPVQLLGQLFGDA